MRVLLTGVLSACALASAGSAIAAQAPARQVEQGKQLYEYWCATCHGPGIGNNGVQMLPGQAALQAKYKGEMPSLLTERADLTPDLVRFFVRNGLSIMPFFRKTELDDAQVDAIGAYLSRNNRP